MHALLTGQPDEFDRRIEMLKAPRYGIVGSTRDIEVRVVETGRQGRAGERVTLKIRREGKADETAHARRSAARSPIPMPFPHAGQNIVEIELETAPGELTPANNRVVVVAEGVRENLRVLLVSGEPHAGERVWRNLLKSDAAVDLVHFTILRPPQKQDGTPIHQLSLIAFPTRELFSEKIKDFDLIIFDRYQHRDILQLLYYENIARYVEQGGALLVAAGDDYAGPMSLSRTPLSVVLPATPTGRVLERPFKAQAFRRRRQASRDARPAGLGGRARQGADLGPLVPPGRRLRRAAAARVMSGAEDRPLLVLDRKGTGRVALLLSDHAWLWARGYEGGGPHTDLLRRLAHWLMKEPDLEEERLLASAKGLKLTDRAPLDGGRRAARAGLRARRRQLRGDAREGRSRPLALHHRRQGARPLQDADAIADRQLHAVAHAGIEDAREMSEVTATDEKLQAPRRGHRRRHVLDARRRSAVERRRPRAWTCRAFPCWPTPACWRAPAGWASRTARPSSPAASS